MVMASQIYTCVKISRTVGALGGSVGWMGGSILWATSSGHGLMGCGTDRVSHGTGVALTLK